MKTIIARSLFVALSVLYLFFLGGFLSFEERNRRRLLYQRRKAREVFIDESKGSYSFELSTIDDKGPSLRIDDESSDRECSMKELSIVSNLSPRSDINEVILPSSNREPYEGMLLAVSTPISQHISRGETTYELVVRVHDELVSF